MAANQDKTLVTGATGLLGSHLVRQLHDSGRPLRILVRDPQKARVRLPEGIETVLGDLEDGDSLLRAIQGCRVVYHAGGLPEQWLSDPGLFSQVNLEGTRSILDACRAANVGRLVYTSSVNSFEGACGEVFDETRLAEGPGSTPYETSKREADRLVAIAVREGLDAVILHPAAFYGPGPRTSPGLNDSILRLASGRMPALPPGTIPVVYVPDAARAHLVAESRAPTGSRYILCERSAPISDIARIVHELTGRRIPLTLPLAAARLASTLMEGVSRVTGRPPLLPRGQLEFLQWGAIPSSRRAVTELGWSATPLMEGVQQVLQRSVVEDGM